MTFLIAEVTLEYENKRHFQSALMRSDRNQFVESNGGNGGNGTMTNGEEAAVAAEATSHMNGNAGGSSFDAPRMPIIFMLGEYNTLTIYVNCTGCPIWLRRGLTLIRF